ncbi:MAG: hypothetical protein NTU74_02255 [Deltaproteobacteria bacterium]|nr:hypothetical protein [Deltaproteobacteria bacterium]
MEKIIAYMAGKADKTAIFNGIGLEKKRNTANEGKIPAERYEGGFMMNQTG